MRRFETPYLADWLATSLRWMVLVGLLISLSLRGGMGSLPFGALLVILGWNTLNSILAVMSFRLQKNHRQAVLGVDFLLAAVFYWLQGGLAGASMWIALIPILTGAVYFELRGAFLVSIAFAAWQMLVSPDQFVSGFNMAAIYGILVTLLMGLVCGAGGIFLMRHIRQDRQTHMDAEERRQRMESERLRAIYELTSTLTATLTYKRVLDSALDLGYTALNPNPEPDEPGVDEKLVSAVFLFQGDELRVGSARRFTGSDLRVTLHGNDGILKRIFAEGDAILTSDIGYDPELGRIIALRNCTTAYVFPLRSGFNVYGAMLFAHPDPNYFTPERRGLLDIIGRQSVIAVQNAKLYQDLVEEKERMIEVQEETRKKLARDLHDGPTQSVAAIAMRINLVRRML
ncbi:MAG: GAF domain-containing protein, partial [Syntrophothermus sp.]